VRGERDDGQMSACLFLFFANRLRGLQAVHFRHLHVHQHQIDSFAFKRFQSLAAIFDYDYSVAMFLKQASGERAIDCVIFRK
jgi:hypothetical protein